MLAHRPTWKTGRVAVVCGLWMFSLAHCGSGEPGGENPGSFDDAGQDASSQEAGRDASSHDAGQDAGSIDAQPDVSIDAGTGEPPIPPWRFAVVGDSRTDSLLDIDGVNDEVWGGLVEQIIAEGAEFVVVPGDLSQSGLNFQLDHWISITQPLYDAGIGVYTVRGNHDSILFPSTWNKAFSGEYILPDNGPDGEKNRTYSFTHKNVLVAAIDNYSGSDKVNQSWLDSVLAANTQPHVFAFGHEPAFAADHADTLDDQSDKRNAFWESLKASGARAYFCGHDHFYDHARIDDGDGSQENDLHQFIVGTGGAPLYAFDGNYVGDNGPYTPAQEYFSDQYGYVVVEVDGLDITLTFMVSVGDTYEPKDSFSYTVSSR